MIKPESFSIEYIKQLADKRKVDIALLERSIYAFGLLEALIKVGLPFIFKGGTSLMLLLDKPRRLSTDIDIMVSPGVFVEEYILKTATIFPFKDFKKQNRKGRNGIEKAHYKFIYDSPVNQKEFYILLDIIYEKNNYARLEEKFIKNEILLTESPYLKVTLPTADCILGDKLTAFAPKTIGIRIGEDKDLEVIKQMFDISCLFDEIKNFDDIYETYYKTAMTEISYRGIDISAEDALTDTMEAAACIVGRGKYGKEYNLYSSAIKKLSGHIYDERFSGETAAVLACKVIYIAACVLRDKAPEKIKKPNMFTNINIGNSKLGKLAYIQKYSSEAFSYLVMSSKLLEY